MSTDRATADVFIALGANVGDREATLRSALAALAAEPGVSLLGASSFHTTTPVGGPANQPMFLNAVAELSTTLSPRELLDVLLRIEGAHGRERTIRNGPRTLDLDLLLFGGRRIDEPELTVPHPRMWQRDFVLAPLRELCGEARLALLRRGVEGA